MSKHTIEIIVDENGNMESEIKGIKGKGCEAISRWLSKLGKVLKHNSTNEKYQREQRKETIKQRY